MQSCAQASCGTLAYQLRAGLFRLVCLNGLMVSLGEIATLHVPHRGNVVDEVVTGALQMSEHFGLIAERVVQMEARRLTQEEREHFANRALDLRFDVERALGIGSLQMLQPRREEDTGTDLWSTYNVIQLWGHPHNWIYVDLVLMLATVVIGYCGRPICRRRFTLLSLHSAHCLSFAPSARIRIAASRPRGCRSTV